MSDHVAIETGMPPWSPSADTELLQVFHRFTIPLVGVFVQAGVHYLFWCVVGHAGPESAWAYAPGDGDSVAALSNADNDTFDGALRRAVGDKASTFAIASDDKGLTVSVVLDPPASFDSTYERGMEELDAKIKEAVEEYDNLMQRFPLMRVPHIAPSPSSPPLRTVGQATAQSALSGQR